MTLIFTKLLAILREFSHIRTILVC